MLSSFTTLLNQYLFPGLRFARAVLYNITGIYPGLVAILVGIPLAYFGFSVANASIRLLVSVWRIWKTGKDE